MIASTISRIGNDFPRAHSLVNHRTMDGRLIHDVIAHSYALEIEPIENWPNVKALKTEWASQVLMVLSKKGYNPETMDINQVPQVFQSYLMAFQLAARS